MQFVNAGPMVRAAKAGGYAVPAFNTNGATYALTRAALESAQEMASPLILQVYQPNIVYRGFPFFVAQTQALCADLGITIPVCLQVDHGKSVAVCREALGAGLTSVMIDGSHEPFDTNVAWSREVLALAKEHGATVEAEIGYVAGNEPKAESQIGRVPVPECPSFVPGKTTVDEAVAFVQAAPVDLLAVAVGTIHGVYKHQTDIDFDLLAELNAAVDVPLVQHGTGGISLADLSRLAKAGMAKINFGEPFRYKYVQRFGDRIDSMEHLWHAWRIDEAIKDELKQDMIGLIEALGSAGKAE
jgi:ketose-bisphosphate aldolase